MADSNINKIDKIVEKNPVFLDLIIALNLKVDECIDKRQKRT